MIKTPDQRLRVFVSSTLGELAEERKAAADAINSLRLAPVLFELGARPHPPKDLYRAYLEQSHIFVGIYWQRYGWVAPDMDISGLEDEYRLAGGMPKLIYVKRPAPDQEERLKALLVDIRNDDRVSYKPFSDAAELKNLIQDDLALLLTESFESSGGAPTPASDETHKTNLPAQPTRFVGRRDDVDALGALLRRDEVRFVSVTGPAGIGKTRLAIEVAGSLIDRFSDGVWLVKLASVVDPNLIVPEIGRAVDAPDRAEGLSAAALQQHIAEKEMLLLLDNFEHLLGGAPVVGQLLAGCPRLKVLVSSRSLLHLRGEHEFQAPTMDLPASAGRFCTPAQALESEAVQLFVERAQASNPRFELTEDNCAAVVEICKRLDGLPLALELAAARTKLLTPQGMLKRMEKRLQLLTGGSRDVPARQRTLRDALDWDYELLSAEEQVLFRSLSVFAGGFSFDSAEAVVNGGDLWIDVFDGIDSLATKSLLRRESTEAQDLRFGTLKTIREYAFERLEESGEAAELQERHARHFFELATQLEDNIRGPAQTRWLERLEQEHDNLRSALVWASEHDPLLHLQLAGALGTFWEYRSYLTEGRYWLELGLRVAADAPPATRAQALDAAGVLARGQGDYPRGVELHEEAVVLRRALDDRVGLSRSLKNLGNVYLDTGQLDRAAELYAESVDLRREVGDVHGVGETLNNLGVLARIQGQCEEATAHYKEALVIFTQVGDIQGRGRVLMNLGEAMYEAGDFVAANNYCKQSLEVFRDIGSRWDIADVLEVMAAIATGLEDPAEAARLFGAAEALREHLKAPLPPSERAAYDKRVLEARKKLDGTSFAVAWTWGRAMSLDEAVSYALADQRLGS